MNPHRKKLTPTKVDTIKKLTRGLVFRTAQQEKLGNGKRTASQIQNQGKQ
jgi:hypothetical protein